MRIDIVISNQGKNDEIPLLPLESIHSASTNAYRERSLEEAGLLSVGCDHTNVRCCTTDCFSGCLSGVDSEGLESPLRCR